MNREKIDLGEIKTRGWTLVHGISSKEELLELGKALGHPVQTPNGEYIKEIKPFSVNDAPSGSQSSIYGKGMFPLHTDTVFWPLPVKYVLLRARGDLRRPTTVRSFADILFDCDIQFNMLAENSVWLVGPGYRKFYCSMRFHYEDSIVWRYDTDLMSPINESAFKAEKIFYPLVKSEKVDLINWSENTAVVLYNWIVMHGRGPEPPNEGLRVIERLYVR